MGESNTIQFRGDWSGTSNGCNQPAHLHAPSDADIRLLADCLKVSVTLFSDLTEIEDILIKFSKYTKKEKSIIANNAFKLYVNDFSKENRYMEHLDHLNKKQKG